MKSRKLIRATLAICVALTAVVGGTGLAAAQSTDTPVDYYNQTDTPSTTTDSWLSGLTDASLDDILTLAVRIGGFIIGDGTAQGGVGSAGALMTGLLVAGVMGGIGIRSGAGASGGVVIGIAAGSVFVTVGIGATWVYPIILFVVGLLVAAVFLRILR